MLGIITGTLCLLGLIAVVRHGRWHRRHHGCGPHSYGYGVSGPRWFLRSLFLRLGTSAAQEKVIVDATRELHSQKDKLWTEWQQSKADLAEALRAEPLDQARVQAAFARHDGLMGELRKGVVEALGKIHGVLDPEQRKALASAIEHPWRYHHSPCC